jgi:NADPH-dependent 2,4-dienoyl-CoA reductase/sulfur reductase-like enzyme
MEKILIVGGNAAGLTAGSRAKRLDPRLGVTVLEKGPFISYSTCGVPYLLSGLVASGDLVRYTPGSLRQERGIDAHIGIEVDSIIPSRKMVTGKRADTGEAVRFDFDRLMIGTGVRPRLPEIPGVDRKNVFTVTGLADVAPLQAALADARDVVIVGGGYVGLEIAESLRAIGKTVTIYERRERVLGSVDEDIARIVEYELVRNGVRLRTGAEVEALVGESDRVSGIKARGQLGAQPADVVLLDTGVVPNVELAVEAGIRTGPTGAIAVNEYMETNVPSVFAAGNCAEAFCSIRRRPILHYVGTVAAKQGRIAGENMTGRRAKFAGSVGTTILKVFELGVGRTGLTSSEAATERIQAVSARIEAMDRAAYYPNARKIWVKLIADRDSRKVIGAQVAGYGDVSKRIDVAAIAVTAGMTVESLSETDLGYTPPYSSLWDPIHVAAQNLLRKL